MMVHRCHIACKNAGLQYTKLQKNRLKMPGVCKWVILAPAGWKMALFCAARLCPCFACLYVLYCVRLYWLRVCVWALCARLRPLAVPVPLCAACWALFDGSIVRGVPFIVRMRRGVSMRPVGLL